jgi:hypothetical protein
MSMTIGGSSPVVAAAMQSLQRSQEAMDGSMQAIASGQQIQDGDGDYDATGDTVGTVIDVQA